MTDPTGLCFLSYRRTRAAEAALIIGALRDRGIPTWQDVADLANTPTEDELRRVLADPATASAVIFATPEVEDSSVIRDVEAPGILRRHLQNDGFFAVPVAAGGLSYSDMGRVLGPNIGPTDITGWNVHRVTSNPIDHATASSIADRILTQRLDAIHSQLPAKEPLTVTLATRVPLSKVPGPALAIDLSSRFNGRVASPGAWESAILPAFSSVVRTVRAHAPGRMVEISGLAAIPAAIAIGAAFLSTCGVQACWRQEQHGFGKPAEIWGLHCERKASGFRVQTHAQTPGASDIALLISVAADVTTDFNLIRASLGALRAVVSVEPPASAGPRPVLSTGQAVDMAHLAIDALRTARTTYIAHGAVHLFLAGPVGLAMMIGQMLNTFGAIQTYEHVPGLPLPYVPAARINPSAS